MKRLSKPLSAIDARYDAIVVGSGYGGGIAASRLARMGYRVALLERGEELHPGEYPDTAAKGLEHAQIDAPGVRKGKGNELYDLRVNPEMNVLIGCGLGGTSLINANVALKADKRVFDDPLWPRSLADADLEEGYARATAMLKPRPYPGPSGGWPGLNKVRAMEKAADAFGVPLSMPPLNVSFEAGHNPAGVWQPACNLCGDCCSGCNTGAKSTTLMNYLPDAEARGAEIFCGAQVRFVEKLDDGAWSVAYDPVAVGRANFEVEPLRLCADIVVLAAGTLGSTEILLRSRARGLALSSALGSRFSGNGDALAFGYNNDQPIDGIGFGWRAAAYKWDAPGEGARPVGPTIAGLIDLRAADAGAANVEHGMVIEEGAIPGAMANLMPGIMSAGAAAFGRDTDPGDLLSEKAREVESLARGPYHGAVNHTQTFLVMSHDGPGGGTMELDGNDRLRIRWPGAGELPGYQRVAANLEKSVKATGGTYVPNPIWTELLQHRLVTVHPLGGCPMAEDAAAGVVDADCRVYDGREGNAVHTGLYVCDGAVMPRSLGVNPLLTISAVAERAMIKLSKGADKPIDMTPAAPRDDKAVGAPSVGVRFTEKMAGTATPEGGGARSDLSFVVTVIAPDVDRLIAEKEHEADLIGTVDMPALSAEPLTVEGGRWNLFTEAMDRVDTKQMVYRMPLVTADGKERFHFFGRKVVHNDKMGFDLWQDTTTLFVTIRKDGEEGDPIFTGELHIAPLDFLRQIETMTVTGAPNLAVRAKTLAKFGAFFGGRLFESFGGPFARASLYDEDAIRVKRPLRAGTPEIHHFDTSDGKTLRLTRYKGGDKGPVIFSHGLGVSSLIFTIDTIDTSMLEYLYAGGFDCWLLDYRASIDLPYAREQFTADDVADKDYPAAIAEVMRLTGAPSVQFVGHCYGAMSFAMAMLGGLKHVRSVVISQIAGHADVPFFTQRMLAYLRAPDLMALGGVKLLDARATTKRNFLSRAIDGFIRFLYPMHPDERTRSITSLRIVALYGPLYRLDRLNQPTLDAMPEMFGKANISAFRQLANIARKGRVVRADGAELVNDANLANWAVPTLFVHGALNRAFLPTGTVKTMAELARVNGAGLYDRVEIPATGHIDCIFGKDAARTVYPAILAHLDKTATD
ncbi:MAG TPA: alpha/beta fold hydrolase [Allosphingosinicella sp.]|nr:alpha/beta fold hydrolase [Allosphingosinicella sp.]